MPLHDQLLASLLYRFNYRVYWPLRNLVDWFYVRAYDRRIIPAYRHIRSVARAKKRHHPFQGAEILRTLERFRANHIVELGSGQSTPFFAAYAARHGAKFTSCEQVPFWQELSNDGAICFGLKDCVVLSDIRIVDGIGGRYEESIDPDADFIYVDGPTLDMQTDAPAGKGVHKDTNDLLTQGGRPRVIMIEGNTDDADDLLEHPAITAYSFQPEFIYAWRKCWWGQALRFRRHSLFIRGN